MNEFKGALVFGFGPVVLIILAVTIGFEWMLVLGIASLLSYAQFTSEGSARRFRAELNQLD